MHEHDTSNITSVRAVNVRPENEYILLLQVKILPLFRFNELAYTKDSPFLVITFFHL